MKLDRRFSRGIQFGASYTFASLETTAAEDLLGGTPFGGTVQNPFDVSSLRVDSPNQPRHVLVFNYILELPFGKGRRFLDHGGVVDKVLAAGNSRAIQRYQSGLPLVVLQQRCAVTSSTRSAIRSTSVRT